ncbi:MAG: ABC transporter ATP-binding protein [Lacrimispora celerecrescens]|nr:ABC transporter ATP-binding protein [Lacrimispora celerecrescens]
MNIILEVSGLSVSLRKRKGSQMILENISCSVRKGECLGILGESGSGKSMTAKAILGLLDNDFAVSGKVLYQGKNLLDQSGEALRQLRGKEIAMVLQNPMTCFDPLYRIGHQLAETLAVHTDWSKDEIYTRSEEILHTMQIRDPALVLEKYPHQLSGGMLQRIMIGLAMALKPALLIADEPTTAIDAITQYAVMEEFRKIKCEHGTAMIFISHDLGAISCVADKLLVLNQGKVADQGSFRQVLHHPADPYTRLLIEKRAAVMGKYRTALQKGEVIYA